MDDLSRMQEFEGAQYLVDEILNVFCDESLLGPDHSIEISLHQLTDEVDVSYFLSNKSQLVSKVLFKLISIFMILLSE